MSRLVVNGKPVELALPASLPDLLAHLEIDPLRVAIILNNDIVGRDHFASIALADGDRLEIIQFVGGG